LLAPQISTAIVSIQLPASLLVWNIITWPLISLMVFIVFTQV